MKFSMTHTFTVTAPQKRVFEALVDPAVIQKRKRKGVSQSGQSTNLAHLEERTGCGGIYSEVATKRCWSKEESLGTANI